jgi:hypothetical protein
MPMMMITTNSSTSVKALCRLAFIYEPPFPHLARCHTAAGAPS